MVHAKGLSDKTVEGILLNNDSDEDFDSFNINKSSGSGSQYEKVIQRWKYSPQLVVIQQPCGRSKRWNMELEPLMFSF